MPLLPRSYSAQHRRLRRLGCPPDLLTLLPFHFLTPSAAYVRSERAMERKFQGSKRPGSERARERNGQRAKAPGSDLARERIGQGPIGRFAPGSELARERKCSVPLNTINFCDVKRVGVWGGGFPGNQNSVLNVCLPEYTYNHASKSRTPNVNLPPKFEYLIGVTYYEYSCGTT